MVMRQLLATLGKKAPYVNRKIPQSWTKSRHLDGHNSLSRLER